MFATGIVSVLSSVVLSVSAAPESVSWQSDYGVAVRKAAEEKKPLAVFIGHGKSGATSVIAEGGLDAKETSALSAGYISVYIDADSESGKKLAASFEITEGVVISDRTGGLQAVVHDGKVTQTQLTDYLVRYSEPTKVVTTTEMGGRRRPIITVFQNVTGMITGNNYCPNCRR